MFNYSGRLFVFGCSMVRYHWPTWADILGRRFNEYQNWGMTGGGNQFIFNSVVEAHQTHKFTKDDTVIVMWATASREDRYKERKWVQVGNVYVNEPDYVEGNQPGFDSRGYLIRDLASITATKLLLESIGINYHFLATVPLIDNKVKEDNDVYNLYSDTLGVIKPSIYEVIFNNDWYTRPDGPNTSLLPNQTQINDILKNYLHRLSNNKSKFSLNFLKNSQIKNKLTHALMVVEYHLEEPRDFHPTPSEHLEYLKKSFPNWPVDDETYHWVKKYNDMVMSTRIVEVAMEWLENPAIPKDRL